MIDSPILRKLKAEWTNEILLRMTVDNLERRFGTRARSTRAELAAVQDEKQLETLHGLAATCADLKEFRAHLRGEKP